MTKHPTPGNRTPAEKLAELHARRARLELGGGQALLDRQHAAGKLSARERVARLADAGSFQEVGLFAQHQSTAFGLGHREMPADGVVTGCAKVDGRIVHLASQDFTVSGGAAGEVHSLKVAEMQQMALKTGSPFIFINDSGGARVQEGVGSLSGYGKVFYQNVMLSGSVPQISLICGPCAGGAAYSPALTDFIIQTRRGQMFITGPQVIRQVTGEVVTAEDLGGPEAQMNHSGVVHLVAEDDEDAVDLCRRLLSFLPSNNLEDPPRLPFPDALESDPELNEVVPTDGKQGYDVRLILSRIVDYQDFLEIQPGFAPNLVIGFGRIQGRPVGLVANQPSALAGALDINSSDKAARFIRFCNAFNLPLVTFVDVPGFLPGVEQEYGGIIRHGAKMLFSYASATVPKVTVIMRKAYGGSYLAMCSQEMGADYVFAWPSAEIAVMGAEGAINVLYSKELKGAANRKEKAAELAAAYRAEFASPYVSAANGYITDVIDPALTRSTVALCLRKLLTKREVRPPKKHGNIPL